MNFQAVAPKPASAARGQVGGPVDFRKPEHSGIEVPSRIFLTWQHCKLHVIGPEERHLSYFVSSVQINENAHYSNSSLPEKHASLISICLPQPTLQHDFCRYIREFLAADFLAPNWMAWLVMSATGQKRTYVRAISLVCL
jgi:hypothetical protein